MSRIIHGLIRTECQVPDPYREVKKNFNLLALELYPALTQKVRLSPNPLEAAVQLAIAGNIIDFGIHTHLQTADVHRSIESSLQAPLDPKAFSHFCQSLKEAHNILYLGDNAGEILFDRLLIEHLPLEKVTLAVRGGPIINDALREDAEMVGLSDLVPIIDNGDNAPGTILDMCSPEFVSRFQQADLVIAKGQGNFETLSEVQKRIFFLFKAKCPVVADYTGCQIDSILLLPSSSSLER
jgi:uncharacterized protein with ATP-grasp and redox domains